MTRTGKTLPSARKQSLEQTNARFARGADYPRILLYSHDSWGLGHLRRSLTLASALTEAFPNANALVVTGSPCASHYTVPERVDVVKLPAVTKNASGTYIPRTLSGPLGRVLLLRGRILLETFRAFAPHLVIVDHQITGLKGEALDLLKEARRQNAKTILGLRDVIDSPEVVKKDWSSPSSRWALTTGYDRICVYGDPEVYDPRREYDMPDDLLSRLEFTGYIVRAPGRRRRRAFPSLRRRVLVTMGGGQDGAEGIAAYLDAISLGPTTWETTILGGPLLGSNEVRHLKHRARGIDSIEVKRFHSDMPSLLQESGAVVSMAGYNTCAEVLQSRRPAVLMPRTFPRKEQLIRAEQLCRLGLATSAVDVSPRELRDMIQTALAMPPMKNRLPNLDGCRRLCEIADELLSEPGRRIPFGA